MTWWEDTRQGLVHAKKLTYNMFCLGEILQDTERVFNPVGNESSPPKLMESWVGPCTVIFRLSEEVYRIWTGWKILDVHHQAPRPKTQQPWYRAQPGSLNAQQTWTAIKTSHLKTNTKWETRTANRPMLDELRGLAREYEFKSSLMYSGARPCNAL